MNNVYQIIASLSLILLLLVACEDNPCEGINCDNGVCDTVTGICLCTRGYQRDSADICTITWTSKHVGTYSVTDSCTGSNAGNQSYAASISALSPTELELSRLGNLGQTVTGRHSNSVFFDVDTVFSGGIVLNGSGSWNDTAIVINYIVHDTVNATIDTCAAIFNP